MFNVFVKKSAEKLHFQRMIALEDQIKVDDRSTASPLQVGEWFRIDRDVITRNRKKIRRACNKQGNVGKAYWKRFEESNRIADENPDQYPRIIETYIFKHDWEYKTEQEMRDMCKEIGEGMCDEVICDLELQMRICNGESATDLLKKADKLPHVRVIELRNGGTGAFGGSAVNHLDVPPAYLFRYYFIPSDTVDIYTPYAFRRVLS